MDPLTELALQYDTDKGPTSPRRSGHNYTPLYDQMLGRRRNEVRRVLEIGVLFGASLKMWHDYFPIALVWGIDTYMGNHTIEADKFPRIILVQGDATQTGTYEVVRDKSGGKFDLIVDDGSHANNDVHAAFRLFAPLLAPNGVYAIEDTSLDGSRFNHGLWLMWNEGP
jgi:cephalosporin hydroxylase